MPSTWDVDAAVLAKLQADAALTAIATDGVWFGEAKATALKWVQVTQIVEDDETMFGTEGVDDGVAFESILYQVKAIIQNTSAVPGIDAAKRIHAVMTGLTRATFAPAGYQLFSVRRETRIRYTERDKANGDLLWQHHGAHYEVRVTAL